MYELGVVYRNIQRPIAKRPMAWQTRGFHRHEAMGRVGLMKPDASSRRRAGLRHGTVLLQPGDN